MSGAAGGAGTLLSVAGRVSEHDAPGAPGARGRRDRSRDAELAAAYHGHRDRIFTSVRRIVGSSAAAADLTHDAFLRALEQLAHFRGDAALGTWIGRIAVNLALRHLRRERRQVDAEPAELEALDLLRPAAPALAEAVDLERAIAGLPESLRTVFVLHAVEGYGFAEIAAMLETSEAACRQRLHRARVRLAATLTTPDDVERPS